MKNKFFALILMAVLTIPTFGFAEQFFNQADKNWKLRQSKMWRWCWLCAGRRQAPDLDWR